MSEQTQQFIMPQTHSGNIVELTDAQKELMKLKLNMKGYTLDTNGELIKVSDPLMNDIGIEEVFDVVCGSLVNRLTVLSNFDEEEVKNQMASLSEELARVLAFNSYRYGIKNQTITWHMIYPSALRLCFVCLKRGFKQGDKQFFSKTYQQFDSKVENISKGKGVSSMMPWGQK